MVLFMKRPRGRAVGGVAGIESAEVPPIEGQQSRGLCLARAAQDERVAAASAGVPAQRNWCDQARLVEGEWRLRCHHETSFVVQRVRILPGQG
jgi:hypothetical protein